MGRRVLFDPSLDWCDAFIGRLGVSGERVIIIHCGTAAWPLAMARRFKRVDVLCRNATEMTEALARVAPQADRGAIFPIGDPGNLPFHDGCADFVFAYDFPIDGDVSRGLQEIARVTKDDGRVYLSFCQPEYLVAILHGIAPALRSWCHASIVDALLDYSVRELNGAGFGSLSSFVRTKVLEDIFGPFWNLAAPKGRACRLAYWAMSPFQKRVESIAVSAGLPGPNSEFYASLEIARLVVAKGSQDQRQRLALALMENVKSQPTERISASAPRPLSMSEVERELELARLRPIGASVEGWLLLDGQAVGPVPRPFADCGLHEVIAVKQDLPGNRWLSPDFFRANAKQAATRFDLMSLDPYVPNCVRSDDVSIRFARRNHEVAARFRHAMPLHRLVEHVIGRALDDDTAFHRLYRFIQDALFHHPVVQPMDNEQSATTDAVAILLGGIGRCGHVTSVVEQLFEILGCETRRVQLHKHVACEVRFRGEWRLVDCDAFKGGVHPVRSDGVWADVAALRENPVNLDACPAIGLQLSPASTCARTIDGLPVVGYVDTGLAWHRPYLSYLYFGGERRIPPQPPVVSCQRQGDGMVLSVPEFPARAECLLVLFDNVPRGWHYEDFPDCSYLAVPAGQGARIDLGPGQMKVEIPITGLDAGRELYINVYARDKYQQAHPDVFVWPGEEQVISTL